MYREAKHFAMLHLNPMPLLHVLIPFSEPRPGLTDLSLYLCVVPRHLTLKLCITGRTSSDFSRWQAPLQYQAWKVASYQCFNCFSHFCVCLRLKWFLCSHDYTITLFYPPCGKCGSWSKVIAQDMEDLCIHMNFLAHAL